MTREEALVAATGPTTGVAAFRPRARLLKLIGAELISDEVVAVTELVKNAHDADASTVTVRLQLSTEGEPELHVVDDGIGMDREALLGRWMEPAGSSKRGASRRVTASGRRVLGEKGVGRFAADKLGRVLELVSRRKGSSAEVHASFNWDAYENETQLLEEIQTRWEIRPATLIEAHGTHLRIRGLRTEWTERVFRRLSTRLSRLRAPGSARHGFIIRLESDIYPSYGGEPGAGYLAQSPYRIEARFDGKKTVSVRVNEGARIQHAWNSSALTCGPIQVRFNAFDLETDALARIGPRADVRAWLREWSGVSVYRDGFRVWPYGEPHDDWLRLDQRRVNNPVVRLSNNQVVGSVEISADLNTELRDQTNREGLLHNTAFEDLRRVVHFVLQLLEAERQVVRGGVRRRPGRESSTPVPGSLVAGLEALISKAPRGIAGLLRKETDRLRGELLQQRQQHLALVQGYAELAAAGQAAAEITTAIPGLRDALAIARQRLRAQPADDRLDGTTSLVALDDFLKSLTHRLAHHRGRGLEGRRSRTADIGEELRTWAQLTREELEGQGFRIRMKLPPRALLRADIAPATLQHVLRILKSNAIDWLGKVKNPELAISAHDAGSEVYVLFGDNGPGVSPALADRIFEPFFTTKEAGHGMGLTLARELLAIAGARISLLMDARRRGATFLIAIPRKRSKSTSMTGHGKE